jgi:3-deoxy-manno-octulosonate cytidylyltransferase (CMP-KDO synthetase)
VTALLAVLPARLAATRLPGKPLRLLGGLPLIVRVLERVHGLGLADRVVVATDAPAIADVVTAAGGEAVLTRDDHPSGTDRVAEAVRRLDWSGPVVNVQGDEPFVSREAVAGAIDQLSAGFAVGTAAVRVDGVAAADPACVKVVRAVDGRALYFSRVVVPAAREPSDAPLQASLLLRHVGVYAYGPGTLPRWVALPEHPLERCERLEQLRPLAHGLSIGVAVVADGGGPGIDTEHDLAMAEARWAAAAASAAGPIPIPEGMH